MDLLFGLAAADQATGGAQTRRLAEGWMGRESALGLRLRGRGARALVALAARLAPAEARPAETERPLAGSTGA